MPAHVDGSPLTRAYEFLAHLSIKDSALVSPSSQSAPAPPDAAVRRCDNIRDRLIREGLFQNQDGPDQGGGFASSWRISPTPYRLSTADCQLFERLGSHLLRFYRALNRLYFESVRGTQPPWVAGYLDQGKPESIVTFARMNRFKSLLPRVLRPDVLQTEHGWAITELDSVPGGIGLTGCLSQAYQEPSAPIDLVGGADGMVTGFAKMLKSVGDATAGHVAIVVSEEAKDYRPEMQWLARQLSERGLDATCLEPRDIRFTEDGLWCHRSGTERPISILYRFFELFDLRNVPKAELIMYSAKKEQVTVTPPFKPALEEKSAFALFHHPVLRGFWQRELGDETLSALTALFPRTWIVDPRPIPPSAVIPSLTIAGSPVNAWAQVAAAGQRDRQLVLKPSGFSELAWGSRGVSIGHDLPQAEWAEALTQALSAFDHTPYILQEFHKGRSVTVPYQDAASGQIASLQGRTRLCPYYFVAGDTVELGGILATVCPADKKIIHGMRDAVMAPCMMEAGEKAEGSGGR